MSTRILDAALHVAAKQARASAMIFATGFTSPCATWSDQEDFADWVHDRVISEPSTLNDAYGGMGFSGLARIWLKESAPSRRDSGVGYPRSA